MSDRIAEGLNQFSERHPHEPAIPAALDSDGRCLICKLVVERDEAVKLAAILSASHGQPSQAAIDAVENVLTFDAEEGGDPVTRLRRAIAAAYTIDGVRPVAPQAPERTA